MLSRLAIAAVLAALTACSPKAEATAEPAETAGVARASTSMSEGLTADHVANLIAADGAAHTLAVLTGPADPTGFDVVTAGIATGDAAWLNVAQSFRPVADGMYGEGLSDALFKALSKNPTGVLAVLKATGGASELTCEQGPDTPPAVVAVTAVTDPALADVKAECLGYMSGPIEG